MDNFQQNALNRASAIFDHFYFLALSEFGSENAKRLAQIPADYVYNELIKNGPNCYINEECCLKYCNEVLDTSFDKFDRDFKKLIYEKANIISLAYEPSDMELKKKLNAFRRKGNVNKIYNDSVHRFRNQREDDLSELMGSVNLTSGSGNDLSDLMGSVNLNKRKNNISDIDFKKLKLS